MLFCGSSALASPGFQSDQHRATYELYGKRYLGALSDPGMRLAAQCWQESRFDPRAVNTSSGATGECQFMAAAWGECLKAANARNVSRLSRRWSIRCAGWYDRKLAGIWYSPRPEVERWRLTLASYNAGPGNIIKAQRRAAGALWWRNIAPRLHEITGRHSRETIDYVNKIERHLARLIEE